MKRASITILKTHLSRYVDAVKSGEEIIVTERGKPVARLTGLDPASHMDGRRAELVREGRMKAPAGAGASPTVAGPPDPEGRSLAILLEERTEGR